MRIIEKLESLRRREHDATVELIAALVECYRTKAYLDAGHESIWDLLVRRLEYSFAAASRRNAATKIVARHPFVLDMLRSHRTSLTVLAKVARSLESSDDPVALLESIDGKSQREVERIVACGRPVDKPAERVRRQVVRRPAPAPAPLLVGAGGLSVDAGSTGRRSAGTASAAEATAGVASTVNEPVAAASVTEGSPAAASAVEVNGAGRAERGTSLAEIGAATPTGPAPDSTSAPEAASACTDPGTEERVSLSFSLTADDYESFEQAVAILARKLPAGMSLEEAFNALVSFYLEKKKPKATGHTKKSGKKTPSVTASETTRETTGKAASDATSDTTSNATRNTTSNTTNNTTNETRSRHSTERSVREPRTDHTTDRTTDGTANHTSAGTTGPGTDPAKPLAPPPPAPRSRHVPAATRAAVFERDGHRCTYVAGDGTRCGATRNLQIDHVSPFALGGTHEPENLRVLCAAHNRRAAERIFGPLPRE